ncbi:unnamed protein product, partial [Mesorhabditis spiculigera]
MKSRWLACHGGVTFSKPDGLAGRCAEAVRGANDAVQAVTRLEQDGSFNCGLGSNLTIDGRVECEAGIMYSDGRFGGVAAVEELATPILLAAALANNHASIHGLVAPNFLAGARTAEYAKISGITLWKPEELINQRRRESWVRAKRKLGAATQGVTLEGSLDTVGAVELSISGPGVACASSGGILLKQPGRVGHCPVWGAGVWCEQGPSTSVAVALSGLGEAIVKTRMASGIADALLSMEDDDLPTETISRWIDRHFTNSKWLAQIEEDRRIAGGIILLKKKEDPPELLVFHNSPHLPVAYTNSRGKVKTVHSQNDNPSAFTFSSVIL